MALKVKTAEKKERIEDGRINEYVMELLDVTYAYEPKCMNANMVNNPFDNSNVTSLDRDIEWDTMVYETDETIKKLIKRKNEEHENSYHKNIERYEYFKSEIRYVGEQISDAIYFKLLVKIWDELYRIKDNVHVMNVFNPYEEDNEECRRIKSYREKLFSSYENTVKDELLRIDGRNYGIKNQYLKNINVDNSGCINQLLFYKNELSPKGELKIDINYCTAMGIPSVEECWLTDSIDSDKRINNILRVWQECTILIKKPSFLYKYQKRIIDECEESILHKAVKGGLFPNAILAQALEYARKNNKTNKLPYLIWLNNNRT